MVRRNIREDSLVSTLNCMETLFFYASILWQKISSAVLKGDRPSVESIKGYTARRDGSEGAQQVRGVRGYTTIEKGLSPQHVKQLGVQKFICNTQVLPCAHKMAGPIIN